MIWATPVFFSPPWLSDGHSTVSPAPSFHTPPDALSRYVVNAFVVPDPSDRWATTIFVDGIVASGLSALISASSQVAMSPCMMPASVPALSCSASTPSRLYDTVIGPAAIGKYR